MTTALIYSRPYLYPKQERALFTDKRWALVEASTKSGKTVGCIVWIIEQALAGNPGWNYWWVAPISDQARIAFTRVKQGLPSGTFTPRESPTPRIEIINGTTIWFKSADNPDSLYGEDVYAAVIDEASRAKEDAWFAVRSTLTATGGPCRIIGNVKGRKNWFYNFCRRVENGSEPNGHFERITVLDAIASGVIPQEEIDDARRNLPDHVFRELYMAEASDDGGNPFGLQHIENRVCALSNKRPVAFGLDLAKKNDWLVLIGLDERGDVCSFSRWRGVPWGESIQRIHETVGEDTPCLVDSTGVGDPVLEQLQVGHGNFFGYIFSAPSKQRLMEGLAVSIQSGEIGFPNGPIRNELETFEYAVGRTGVHYSAPEGLHDDCVCALALARQQFVETAPGANLTEYMAEQQRLARLATASSNAVRAQNQEMMPWRQPKLEAEPGELSEYYEAMLREQIAPNSVVCARCGNPVDGPSRVSDGEFVWHMECSMLCVA